MPNPAALLDLNMASRAELDSLPGVTAALADAIIAARPFRAVGDLSRVPGLTPEIVAGIVPHVTVRRTPTSWPPTKGGSIPPPPNYTIKSPYSRKLYSIPVKTRYRFMAGALYSVVALLVLAGGAWLYFTWSVGNGPVAAIPPSATLEITATFTPQPTETLAASATNGAPSATPLLPTETSTLAPSETAAPTFTITAAPTSTPPPPTNTFTPSPSRTASLVPSPTLTRTRRPTSTLPPTRTPFPTRTPTATRTLTPTPTATATFPALTPPANTGALLFAEQFNPPRYRWVTRQLDPIVSEIGAGVLTLGVRRSVVGYTYSDAGPAADVYYQATARVEACAPEDHYGLQVRLVDENNFYLFGVTCAGGVRVQINENGRYRFLADAPPNSAINIGPNAENVLAVRTLGENFTFIVNGTPVLTLNNAALGEGRFGVYARSIVSPQLTVTFDDVAGWAASE